MKIRRGTSHKKICGMHLAKRTLTVAESWCLDNYEYIVISSKIYLSVITKNS